MMVKTYLIDALGHLLFSARFWADVKMFVTDAQSTDLSGPEKKANVIEDLVAVFGDIGAFALNLGIELAKAWLAVQAPAWVPLVQQIDNQIGDGK